MFLGLMGLEERKERPNYSPTLRRGRGVVESYVTLQLTVGRLLSRFCEGAEAALLSPPLSLLGLGVQMCDLLLHMAIWAQDRQEFCCCSHCSCCLLVGCRMRQQVGRVLGCLGRSDQGKIS